MESHCIIAGQRNVGVTQARSIIVFESMSRVDVAWACFSVLLGKSVLYIKKARRSARTFLAWALHQSFFRRRIKKFRFAWRNDYYDGMWADRAFDVIDRFYVQAASLRFMRALLAKFGYAAELAVKKELVTHLSRFFYLNELLCGLSRSFNSRIAFVPAYKISYNYYVTGVHEAVYYEFFKKLACAGGIPLNEHKNVSFSVVARALGTAQVCAEILMRHARMAARIAKYFRIALKNAGYPKSRQSWRYGFMIMSLDRQFQNDSEGLDFLIDGIRIKKEEMVFIPHSFVRLGSRELAYIKRKKINYIHDLHDYYSLSAWTGMVRTWSQTLFTGLPFLLKVAHALCAEWALWESFSSCVHLDHVIGHHDVSVSALCRNILLEERQGTRSWLYLDSNNFSNFCAPEQTKISYKVNFFSFMKYSYVVCWNKKMEQILSSMHNKVNAYYQPGCLWSTFIKRQMSVVQREKNRSMCTIAVFDGSYIDYSRSSPRCAYFFYKGILRLLDAMDDVRIIIKPKKSRNHHGLVYEDHSMFHVIDMLARHPRCELVDYTTPRGEIIAQADLLIAYPFTSPAFEAVCAGVPAIYFDATGAFVGSRYYKCGMVASGYGDLIQKIEYFLGMTQADFDEWRHVHKAIFDEFLDGRALDRFIDKLASVT